MKSEDDGFDFAQAFAYGLLGTIAFLVVVTIVRWRTATWPCSLCYKDTRVVKMHVINENSFKCAVCEHCQNKIIKEAVLQNTLQNLQK